MKRVVKVWAPTYVAEADDFSYLWTEPDRRSAGIRLYNARVTYYNGRKEIIHTFDIHLNPDGGICWGYMEVHDDAED
jgi:hypothetical protein